VLRHNCQNVKIDKIFQERAAILAITATAGEVSAAIEPRRPSWADMQKHYPAKATDTKALYDKIGGALLGGHKKKWLANTCAVRMSYALLRSGFNLSRTADREASKLGGDQKWYWLRVADLRTELYSRFKGYDAELKLELIDNALIDDFDAMRALFLARKAKAEAFLNTKLAGKNGIIVFGVTGWGTDATGHFTLWDGTAMGIAFGTGHDDPTTGSYYPWLTELRTDEDTQVKFMVQVNQIQFWELK
jgi:hypothetical protein